MKRALFLILLLVNTISIYALDFSRIFAFNEQKSIQDYQQYVGQSFFVRPAYGLLETWEKSGFKYKETYEGRIFTISEIKVKDVTLNKKPNREISVVAFDKESNRKIKFKGYEKISLKVGTWSGVKKWPLISDMPIVFIEPYENFKKENIGKVIKHEMVKDQYEITNVSIGAVQRKDYTLAETTVEVKNTRTGEVVQCPYSDVKIDPFKSALEGSYKTALLKVEKPDDSSDRYSKTQTILDEGVDKYSYSDSIINILIYGTSTQFNFVLKNISNHSIKIIWNEAAFVGLDGSSSKIMHVGTKYSQREGDQPSTTIIRGAKIEDVATPTANVYYNEGITIGYTKVGNGWETHSMLPKDYSGKEAGVIRLMLPIQVKDVVNEYTFVFKVYYSYKYPELLNAEKL